jgi:hypothetical protein
MQPAVASMSQTSRGASSARRPTSDANKKLPPSTASSSET